MIYFKNLIEKSQKWLALALVITLVSCGNTDTTFDDYDPERESFDSEKKNTSPDPTSLGGNKATGTQVKDIDISGSYAGILVLTAKLKDPNPGSTDTHDSTIKSLTLINISKDGDNFVSAGKICSINQEQSPALGIKTYFSDGFLASIPQVSPKAKVLRQVSGKVSVNFDTFGWVSGANLSDPLNDKLPTNKSDPSIVDSDSDSKPGITIRLTGRFNGEIYVVQRIFTALSGDYDSSTGVISGLAESSIKANVIDASSNILKAVDITPLKHEDASKSYFKLKPDSSITSCDQLIAAGETYFNN